MEVGGRWRHSGYTVCIQKTKILCTDYVKSVIPYQRREAGKSILLLRLWIMRAATKEFGGQAC